MSKRDYIAEILAKKGRLHRRGSRQDLFTRRIYPLVEGFRELKGLKRTVSFRDEWLKYGAIGYIACVEGYFRLLLADLINRGDPFLSRIGDLRDVRFSADVVIAVHREQITLGEYIAHLLAINGVSDINSHMSALIGTDFLSFLEKQPVSLYNQSPMGHVFPKTLSQVEALFKLRHLYAHELATKEKVPVRRIEDCISATAIFVTQTEELAASKWLK